MYYQVTCTTMPNILPCNMYYILTCTCTTIMYYHLTCTTMYHVSFFTTYLGEPSQLKSAKTWEKFPIGDDPPAPYTTWETFETNQPLFVRSVCYLPFLRQKGINSSVQGS